MEEGISQTLFGWVLLLELSFFFFFTALLFLLLNIALLLNNNKTTKREQSQALYGQSGLQRCQCLEYLAPECLRVHGDC